MTEPSACGPLYLGVDETQTTILNINDMARVAFRLATTRAINVLLERRGELPLTSQGTSDEQAAKLLATHFVLYNDQGRGGEPQVFGSWVMVPQSEVNRAMEQGHEAFVALLEAGADKAANQPETQDSLDFLEGLVSPGAASSLASETVPVGSRATHYALALSKAQGVTWTGEVPRAKSEAQFLALMAGGVLHDEVNKFFNQKNVTPSAALQSFIDTLDICDPGSFWRVYKTLLDPYSEAGGKGITRLSSMISNHGKRVRHDFIDLVTSAVYDVPTMMGGLYVADQRGAIESFNQARALWRQSQGQQPDREDANRLGLLFFEDAKTTGRPVFAAWAPHNRDEEVWSHTLNWMAQCPDLDHPDLVGGARDIIPGFLGADPLPDDPSEFFRVVFNPYRSSGGKPSWDILARVGGEDLVRQVIDKALALHEGNRNVDAIFSRVMKNGCASGGSRLMLVEAVLGHDDMVEILAKHKPQINELKDLRNHIIAHELECPRVVFFLDESWRKINGHALGSDNFNKAWSAWTKDDKPHMESGHQMALSYWRQQALGRVVDTTQATDDVSEPTKPRPRM